MRNPFARPETAPQWLLGSACWVLACFGGWFGGWWLLAKAEQRAGGLGYVSAWFAPFGFAAAWLLVWRFAVLRAWMLAGWDEVPTAGWLQALAYAWFAALVLALLLGALALLFLLLFVTAWT